MKPRRITNYKGKGGRSELLPSRSAMNTITGGDPSQRSINNYARLTPGGADRGVSVMDMSRGKFK